MVVVTVIRSEAPEFPVGTVLGEGFPDLATADQFHDDFMDAHGDPDLDVRFAPVDISIAKNAT